MLKRNKVFLSILASLIPGGVFTYLLLPHFQWYLKRSPTVQLLLKSGIFTLFSLLVFGFIVMIWTYLEEAVSFYNTIEPRPSFFKFIALTVVGIKKRLPDLEMPEQVGGVELNSWFPILTLSVIPIVVALVNQEWLFTRAGEVDPWNYVSLGYYYFKDPLLFSGGYKLSRVPWILVEALIRNLFTPTASAIILALGFGIMGSIGFYLLVSSFFGKTTGFVSAALLGTYSYYLINRATDYQNTAGIVFFIWSLYFLNLAIRAEKNQRWWFLAFGATFGIAAHSEIFVLGCLPAVAVQFFTLYSGAKKRFIWKAILFSLAGFLAITGLLGLAALSSGRSFFFFMDQLSELTNYSNAYGANLYSQIDKSWPLQAKYLALPVAVFLFAAGWIVINTKKILFSQLPISRPFWFQFSLNLQMTVVGIIWLAGEIFHKEALLRYYLVHPIYIYAFLAFAGFLAMEQQIKLRPIILAVALLVVCVSLAFSDQIFQVVSGRLLPQWQIFQPLLFYLLLVTGLTFFKRGEGMILAIVLLMSLGNIMGMGVSIKNPGTISPDQLSLDYNQCHVRQDGYLSVIDTFQRLWEFGLGRTHLWWDPDELLAVENCPQTQMLLAKIGLSVTRTGVQDMSNSEPSLPIETIHAAYYKQLLKQNAAVAVISNDPSKATLMLAKLRTYGNWALAKQETIIEGEFRFSLYVFTLDGKIR